MLAAFLLVLLAAEAAALAWLGVVITADHGALPAVTLVVLLAVGFNAFVMGITFVIAGLARRQSAERVAMSPVSFALEFAREVFAYFVAFTVLQPFVRLTMGPPARAFGPSDRTPLLLVHGYLCNRGLWWHVARRLAARGYRVHTIDLEPPLGDIDDYGRQIDRRIEEVRAANGGRAPILIGHSMGGLAIRACMRARGPVGVRGVVTLGTPHGGTALAPWGLGLNAFSMRLAGPWLLALAQGEGSGFPIPVVSIYSSHDNFVSPPEAARLVGATNVRVVGVGHLAMAFSRRVDKALMEALAAIEMHRSAADLNAVLEGTGSATTGTA
jgi:pimeloyl-ACP methyl ester carboxylesterase